MMRRYLFRDFSISALISSYPGFPRSAKDVYKRQAQDCISSDCVPYIGLYSANSPNWYVCTGFMKWGMTSSMVCANIISDCILKNNNKYLELFSPQRFNSSSVPMLIKNGIEAVKGIAREHFTIPDKDPVSYTHLQFIEIIVSYNALLTYTS